MVFERVIDINAISEKPHKHLKRFFCIFFNNLLHFYKTRCIIFNELNTGELVFTG